MEALNARAPAPDLTLFLEVRPAVAIARRAAASGARELFEVPAFQRRVARAYASSLSRLEALGQRVQRVDGEGSMDAVTTALGEAVAPLLRPRRGLASPGGAG